MGAGPAGTHAEGGDWRPGGLMIELDGVVQRHRLAAYAWCEDAGQVLLVRIAPGEAGAGQWIPPGG